LPSKGEIAVDQQDQGQGLPEIHRILSGDESGWTDLYERVLNLAKKFVRLKKINAPDKTAGEIAHEIAVKFFERHVRPESLRRFINTGISSYVARMVANWAVDFFEQQAASRELLNTEDIEAETNRRPPIFLLEDCWPSELWSPERILQFKQSVRIIRRAIDGLSKNRKAVIMGSVAGLTHDAIAKKIGKKARTIGQELRRARKDLLKLLPPDCVPVKGSLF
jgi:RNA polymerase sigma factor (sigma-70 family)